MLTGEPFLYHSVLSIYLNAGLLDPLAICRRVEQAYREGMKALRISGASKVAQGLTTLEEILKVAPPGDQ